MLPPRRKYEHRVTDDKGVIRFYFRRDGKTTALPDPRVDEEAFDRAYIKARYEGEAPKPREPKHSLEAIAKRWFEAMDPQIARSTAKEYRGYIRRICAHPRGGKTVGELSLAQMQRRHVLQLLDDWSAKPREANGRFWVLRQICAWALDREMIAANPCADVRGVKYKAKGATPWNEADLVKYETRWDLGTQERLAYDLLLYTAQRIGDVRRLGWGNVENNSIRLTQSKTGTELVLAIHPRLATSLSHAPRDRVVWLVNRDGKARSENNAVQWFGRACEKAGLDRTAHGLRKSAATLLAEAGCSTREIMAMTGHKTLAEVERYTAGVDQRRTAERVVTMLRREK